MCNNARSGLFLERLIFYVVIIEPSEGESRRDDTIKVNNVNRGLSSHKEIVLERAKHSLSQIFPENPSILMTNL